MIKYFISFVICNRDGRLEGKVDCVSAPEGADEAQLLELLQEGTWPGAEYITKFEPWD